MYITASWVQAPNKDLGTNIVVHPGFSAGAELGEAPTTDDAKRVAEHPAPEDRSRRRVQIPPRMNRVLAYLDIVTDDRGGDPAGRIRNALAAHDPSLTGWVDHGGVFVQFFVQPYMSARRDTYAMLSAQLDGWLGEHFAAPLAAVG
jgi:hypothetical protein